MESIIRAIAARLWPIGRFADTTEGSVRVGGEGSIYSLALGNTTHMLADEGNYFIGCNVPGTTFSDTAAAQTALADTVPIVVLKNNDVATNSSYKRIYIDYIRLIQGATLPSGTLTSFQSAIKLDNNPLKVTTTGTAITPANCNMDVNTQSIAQLYAGALVVVGSSANARTVHRSQSRAVTPVIGDQYIWSFGPIEFATSLLNSGGAACIVKSCAPAIIGPQQSLCLYIWEAGRTITTAGTYEIEVGWFER